MATCPKTSKMGKGRSTIPYGAKAAWKVPGKIRSIPRSSKSRSGKAVGRKTRTVDRMAPYRLSKRVRRDPRGMDEGPRGLRAIRQARPLKRYRNTRMMPGFAYADV